MAVERHSACDNRGWTTNTAACVGETPTRVIAYGRVENANRAVVANSASAVAAGKQAVSGIAADVICTKGGGSSIHGNAAARAVVANPIADDAALRHRCRAGGVRNAASNSTRGGIRIDIAAVDHRLAGTVDAAAVAAGRISGDRAPADAKGAAGDVDAAARASGGVRVDGAADDRQRTTCAVNPTAAAIRRIAANSAAGIQCDGARGVQNTPSFWSGISIDRAAVQRQRTLVVNATTFSCGRVL